MFESYVNDTTTFDIVSTNTIEKNSKKTKQQLGLKILYNKLRL